MKLSKRQQHVIDRLNEGWELARSTGFYTRVFLQKGGIGRGGETENVHESTFESLRSRGLIKFTNRGYPTSVYRLAEQTSTDKEQP